MPIITVAAAPHAEERVLLNCIADAVADALALDPGDVIVMSIPVHETVTNGAPADATAKPWVIISIHGSDRGAEPIQRARSAARDAAADWNRRHADSDDEAAQEGVWCEWLLPQHP